MRPGSVQLNPELIFGCNDEFIFDDLHKIWNANSKLMEKISSSPPDNIAIVGSFLLRSMAKPHQQVDVSVTIPSRFIDDTDRFDHHYFVKRCAYTCYIAQHLKSYEMFNDLEIQCFRNDSMKPCIVIKQKASKFLIRILVVLDSESIDRSRLGAFEFNCSQPFDNHCSNKDKRYTAHHNHAILEDMYMFDHLQLLHEHMRNAPSIVEACTLLKVWSRQRVMYHCHDTLNGFLLSILVIYLVIQGRINRHMSSFQIIKIFMNWLSSTDLINEPITLSNQKENGQLNDMKTVFDIVVLDQGRDFNLFHRVTSSAWKQVRHEATLTLRYLDQSTDIDAIKFLFLYKHSYWSKYDLHLNIFDIPTGQHYDMSWYLYFVNHVVRLLEKSLHDKCVYVRPVQYKHKSILFGIILSDHRDDGMIIGPNAADVQQRDDFVTFWGHDKTKMIQFKDGSLRMVCEWNGETSFSIIEQIAKHVMLRHMNVDNVQLLAKELCEKQSITIVDPLEELKTLLTTSAPSCLNLEIKSVAIASSHLLNDHDYGPVRVVVEFYDNSKWPDDVQAIHNLKRLIYLKWYQALNKKCQITAHETCMDIKIKAIMFRVVIRLLKEINIYKTSGMALDERVIRTEKELVHSPLHYEAMNMFKSRFPLFLPALRLVEQWTHSQLFSDHIDSRLIELLCAHVFAHHDPYEAPKSPQCAFIRFIQLIVTHSWHDTALLVNLADNHDTLQQQQQQLNVEQFPMCVMVSYDGIECNNYWTSKQEPSRIIVNRFIQHAKQTEHQLTQLYNEPLYCHDWHAALFHTTYKGFDILLHLKTRYKNFDFDHVSKLIADIKHRFGDRILLFRNALQNDVIALVWNPFYFVPKPFRIDKTMGTVLAVENESNLSLTGACTVLNVFQVLDELMFLGKDFIDHVQFLQQSESSKLPQTI